jgi:hypothetical protein
VCQSVSTHRDPGSRSHNAQARVTSSGCGRLSLSQQQKGSKGPRARAAAARALTPVELAHVRESRRRHEALDATGVRAIQDELRLGVRVYLPLLIRPRGPRPVHADEAPLIGCPHMLPAQSDDSVGCRGEGRVVRHGRARVAQQRAWRNVARAANVARGVPGRRRAPWAMPGVESAGGGGRSHGGLLPMAMAHSKRPHHKVSIELRVLPDKERLFAMARCEALCAPRAGENGEKAAVRPSPRQPQLAIAPCSVGSHGVATEGGDALVGRWHSIGRGSEPDAACRPHTSSLVESHIMNQKKCNSLSAMSERADRCTRVQ